MESIFFWLGLISFCIFLFSVVFDDVLELDFLDFDGLDDWLTVPVICGFLAAFGFVAWATMTYTESWILSVLLGSLVAPFFGGFAAWLIRKAREMPTDETPKHLDMLGKSGTVVTVITPTCPGEVILQIPYRYKVSAKSESTIDLGELVVVTEVLSETSVVVMPEEFFWATTIKKGD